MKKKNTYEVHVPMPYCEVWVIEASSVKEAKKIVAGYDLDRHGYCVGEIASRRKKIRKVK